LRSPQLAQAAALVRGYAAVARAAVGVIRALNTEIAALGEQVEALFGQHPDVAIYRSQPGVGDVLGARVLGEFGDDPQRYVGARARKNYASTSPLTRASGRKKAVTARYVGNSRLLDALHQQAFCATNTSPGAKAYYDELRARAPGTTPRCVSSRTVWSASCTAASRAELSTTRPPPGATAPLNSRPPSRDHLTLRPLSRDRSRPRGQGPSGPDRTTADIHIDKLPLDLFLHGMSAAAGRSPPRTVRP
jgi:hypothetical protein